MESLQGLKSRLKAVKNVGQITKAMEVVAATKMRKAQESALNSRPYAFEALFLLERLIRSMAGLISVNTRLIKKTLVVVIASDKGLAGSFNSQVFRLADSFFAKDEYLVNKEHEYGIVAVGKKAIGYAGKKKFRTIKIFEDFGDVATLDKVYPMTEFISESFEQGDWDRIVIISTNFRSALKQEPLIQQVYPFDFNKIRETVKEIIPETGKFSHIKNTLSHTWDDKEIDYIFEPSVLEVFESLIPHLIEMQVYHIFLEAKASEHSARRVAMKTASDNAIELTDDLTIIYNKARQVGITAEIMEITSTMTTLEK